MRETLSGIGLVLLLVGISGSACYGITGVVVDWLRRRAVLDHPNERSSHAAPTPRGGGIGLLAVLLPFWAYANLRYPMSLLPAAYGLLASMVGLAAISFLDDLRSLPPWLRFAAQIAAVANVLSMLPADHLVFGGAIPILADRVVTGLAWLWFLNLFNFMDGIDGISGVEAASIATGVTILSAIVPNAWFLDTPSLILIGCVVAFLAYNWHPAKVFMGDVGSIPLGFALFWLLLMLWLSGAREAALILPAYYLADATLTLGKRILRGEKIWQAHRSHFYQRAAQNGASHDWIVRRILATNVGLIAIAVATPYLPAFIGLALAAIVTAALLIRLATIRVAA
jgi:UDP-N-acetylmuramyl pentapeptide phosphotransferase/UDP-N-acetylglucosamine-1-phosphate transferase